MKKRARYDLVLNICLTNFCMSTEYCHECRFLDEEKYRVCNITKWALDDVRSVFDEYIISKLLEICNNGSDCSRDGCILATGSKGDFCIASITALKYLESKGMRVSRSN